MKEGFVIGVDIGSSAVKATAFDEEWVPVGHGRRSYHEWRGGNGELTLPVRDVLEGVRLAVRQCCTEAGQNARKAPLALAIACLGEALVPVDVEGNPLADAMLNGDARLSGAAAWWRERMDLTVLQDITGLPVRDTWSANIVRHHLANLERNEPVRFLTLEDLVVAALGIEPKTSLSLATRFMMADHRSRQWSPAILDVLGIYETCLPSISMPAAILGTTVGVNDFGLPAGVIIASGGHDQFCAATGSGATTRVPMWSTGTVDSFVTLTADAPPVFPTLPHYEVDDGLYVRSIPNLNGGRALSWLARLLGIDRVEEILTDRDPPERILVLPTLGTTGAPDFDPSRTASMHGLTYSDTPEIVAGAMIEGIVLETRHAVMSSGLDTAGFEAITVAGGSSQSARWLKLKADALNLPVIRRLHFDAGCVGAAMLAREAVDGVRAGIDSANPRISVTHPSTEGVGRFERQAMRYGNLRSG